jgi:hypothetical protein
VLTTLINSILNSEFVTMSKDLKTSDNKWSYRLWLKRREPHPAAEFSKETQSGRAAIKARNVSRKACPERSRRDARPQIKSPFHPPLAKGGKRGILPKWCLADAVQACHENDLKHLKLNKKEFAQAAAGASSA